MTTEAAKMMLSSFQAKDCERMKAGPIEDS